MIITEVTTPLHCKHFLSVVNTIYKGDANYVRPLNGMIDEIFDPKRNKLFENGKAVRFVLYNDNRRPVGRIAAFINANKAYKYEQPTGGVGFFECPDNPSAATLLFDAARQWLQNNGMAAMDGPINFGENDNFWGLLVDGFTPAAFGMAYNPPYYRALFENYGFQTYYEQITNHLDLKKQFPERFWRIAERIMAHPGLEFRHFSFSQTDRFINDIIEIYNDAWQFHESFAPLAPQHLHNMLGKAKHFLNEELIWFAYANGEPIAFLAMFPDVNQILKHFNGKIGTLGKLKFWWLKRQNAMTRTRVTALGVKTHYQRMGVESGLFYQLRDVVTKNPHITEMELSWVGDFNPKMRALQEAMGSVFAKRHITYRYLFDPEKRLNFERSKSIPVDTKEKNR